MKKILFVLVLAIMTMAVPMEAQKKAATPKNDTVPQIEAYSDTTSLDSVAMDDEFWDDDDAWDRMSSSDTNSLMSEIGVDGGDIMGMFFVIVVLIIIFILAPVGLIGIILFAITTAFSLVTLPVEINASKRALAWLSAAGMTTSRNHAMAEDALKAAAYTYVVAAVGSMATLLYYIMIYTNRRD